MLTFERERLAFRLSEPKHIKIAKSPQKQTFNPKKSKVTKNI
ncbi:hypothetical protein VCRA2113O199_10606 [Vibrio crassostreae]|nr:hypothetical protein VCRA2110O173_150115 [Vibrio crassostreae]CAK1888383.1 hypothetical protein VCRA2115O371_10601 [Vibrio crassostreae]CAK1897310.1 hypothetical protein VCRA2113O199_10606 [Vibrio crassostreae]CAK1900412.1 hypothetical protein VCRA2113O354_10601 [Vibrio crassostreae]CAK2305788.1 hypothetical protein VCRA2113O361_10601 [Vibrio crassostreae]